MTPETATPPSAKESAASQPAAPITLTPNAARKVTKMMAQAGRPQGVLRIAVVSGGCSGLQYQMDIQEAPGPQDVVGESQGVKLAVDHRSARFLGGTEVDYVFALQDAGFKIRNPNATHSCSCGESFCA